MPAQELADLIELIEYRPEVMAEALAQATDMVGYWAGMLMFSRSSHPWTFRLARIAIVVGEFVAMKLKRRRSAPAAIAALAGIDAAALPCQDTHPTRAGTPPRPICCRPCWRT